MELKKYNYYRVKEDIVELIGGTIPFEEYILNTNKFSKVFITKDKYTPDLYKDDLIIFLNKFGDDLYEFRGPDGYKYSFNEDELNKYIEKINK